MKFVENQDRTFDLLFGYDPLKVKLCRVLGAEFTSKGGNRWSVSSPEMIELIKRCQKIAIIDGKDTYEVIRQRCSELIAESQTAPANDLHFPVPDPARQILMDHQRSAVKWVLEHRNVLEMDPMGAGKTIICAVAGHVLRAKRVLIICMATLKANWRSEWRKWNVTAHEGNQTVASAQGSFWPNTDVVIVNYDIIDRFRSTYLCDISGLPVPAIAGKKFKLQHADLQEHEYRIEEIGDEEAIISGPDGREYKYAHDGERIVIRMGEIDSVDWDLVIADECHKFKSPKTIRTINIIGAQKRGRVIQTAIRGKRHIAMSGTVIANRPIEGWAPATWLWPESFPSYHLFGMKYCNGHKSARGWDLTGHSNEQELNARLRLLGMIARPKSITHKDLPPKTRKIIEFELPNADPLLRSEADLYTKIDRECLELKARSQTARVFKDEKEWREQMKHLKEQVELKVGELTALRVEIMRRMMPDIIAYVKEQIQERGKVCVFCWHKEVADELERAFPKSAKVTGDVPTEDRMPIVWRFRDEQSCTPFIGTIATAVGYSTSVASLVLMIELHWVPGDVLQAEDRPHRKGLTEPLEVRYLIPSGSITAIQAERLIAKMEVIEACTGPLRAELEEIPISLGEDEVDLPAACMAYPDLEELAKRIKPTEAFTIRDKLLQIARGRYRKKPPDVDHMVAARLSGHENWTPIQHALSELIVTKYGVIDEIDFVGTKGLTF